MGDSWNLWASARSRMIPMVGCTVPGLSCMLILHATGLLSDPNQMVFDYFYLSQNENFD
jgi:hypothetical protein